jgi:DNA (cytosine-5)-methyltransferase 1
MWRVLDLFCGAGGAAMGLHRAWPDAKITGVDINPQKNYPFDFVQADAMLLDLDYLQSFDFLWASPVCKGYSALANYGTNARRKHEWPDQIPGVRVMLAATGKPFVIENVPRAPLETDKFLCGQMFGLPLIRHRFFETNFFWLRPEHRCANRGATRISTPDRVFIITGHGGGCKSVQNRSMHWTKAQGIRAMGIDWMTRKEMAEAIPPAYSQFIAHQFRRPNRFSTPITIFCQDQAIFAHVPKP